MDRAAVRGTGLSFFPPFIPVSQIGIRSSKSSAIDRVLMSSLSLYSTFRFLLCTFRFLYSTIVQKATSRTLLRHVGL